MHEVHEPEELQTVHCDDVPDLQQRDSQSPLVHSLLELHETPAPFLLWHAPLVVHVEHDDDVPDVQHLVRHSPLEHVLLLLQLVPEDFLAAQFPLVR